MLPAVQSRRFGRAAGVAAMALFSFAASGCPGGGTDAAPPGTDGGPGSDAVPETDAAPGTDAGSDAAPGSDAGKCTMIESAVANEGWAHVAEGTATTYAHNPPASGNHYAPWARYEVFATAIPRGYWVHNIEHGGIVLLYNPGASAATIADLTAAWTAIPDDPACAHRRALLTPDLELDDTVAVVAADWVLEGPCVDQAAILAFVTAHRAMAPEDVCTPGTYP